MRYVRHELWRRWSRTLVTALGLAAGVGLVMGIVGVSNGLSNAQNKVLSPLSSVGTDIVVERTVGVANTSSSTLDHHDDDGTGRLRRRPRRRRRRRWLLRRGVGEYEPERQ